MKNISISFVFLLYILSPITAQYDDPKWEFGAEVGFAWIGFPRQVIALDIFDTQSQETNRTNRMGFRAFATAKYNLIDQIQILGSIGLVSAKGAVKKNRSTRSLFGSTTTLSSEVIMLREVWEVASSLAMITSSPLSLLISHFSSTRVPLS